MPDDDQNSNTPEPLHDSFDDKPSKDPLVPENIKKIPDHQTAVAIKNDSSTFNKPKITAAGREKLAEQILNLAFANGVLVREDAELAEMLASLEIDSPIPQDAFIAVAEILSQVYKANGQEDPFNAILNEYTQTPDPDKKDD